MIIAATLAIIGILGAIAVLSLARIKSWLRNLRATRAGKLIKREMENGNFEIVSIGLSENGTETGEKTWTAKSLDPELADAFGYSNYARITL
jgi:type II secretory pathway pseudopilin PulG